MASLFITGAGTDVGKTFVAATLIRALRDQGRAVEALKPVVSGFDPADWTGSDPGRLLAALGRDGDREALEALSPWRYAAPLSPDMAAAREGRTVDYAAVVELCRTRLAAATDHLLIIEGVGGVMSPIDADHTNLDLMSAVGAPVLLVAGSYLGTISHTLTAISVLRARGLDLRAVVISESASDGPGLADTVAGIARLARTEQVIAAGRNARGWEEDVLTCVG